MSASANSEVIRFELRQPTPPLNRLLRMHWAARKKYRRALAKEVLVATLGNRPAEPIPKARVTIERHSTGTIDPDSLSASAKEILDCLVSPGEPRCQRGKWYLPHPHGLGIILDDRPECLDLVPRAVRVSKRSEQKTVVTIEALT